MTNDPPPVKEIFLSLLKESSLEERERRLAELCGDRAELQERVRALLRAHQTPDSLFPLVEVIEASEGISEKSAVTTHKIEIDEKVNDRIGSPCLRASRRWQVASGLAIP